MINAVWDSAPALLLKVDKAGDAVGGAVVDDVVVVAAASVGGADVGAGVQDAFGTDVDGGVAVEVRLGVGASVRISAKAHRRIFRQRIAPKCSRSPCSPQSHPRAPVL